MLDVTDSWTPSPPARTRSTRAGVHDVHDVEDASKQDAHRRERDPDYPSLRTVVAMAREGVEGCDLASGFLLRAGEADAVAASEPLPADLDLLQHEAGEGPGLHACSTASIVTIDDLSTDADWPSFSARAHGDGFAAAAFIPLVPGRDVPSWCGWLTLYSRQPGPFPDTAIALAETLGLYYSNTVNSALHAKHLEDALASRDIIGQAKGIIMARKNIDDEQAFSVLRQASQHSNRRLRDVAETVVRSCGRQGVDEQQSR